MGPSKIGSRLSEVRPSLADELLGDWKKKEVDDLDIAQQKNMNPFRR